jgi:hypothetical protein
VSVEIEPLDLFGLARMLWQGQQLRECLTDQARFDAGDRMQAAIEMGAPGSPHSRLVVDVAQDAAGRWWSGFGWSLWPAPDNVPCGRHTPIDALRADTREEAVRMATRALLESLPSPPKSQAARVVDTWRRELAALAESERRAA